MITSAPVLQQKSRGCRPGRRCRIRNKSAARRETRDGRGHFGRVHIDGSIRRGVRIKRRQPVRKRENACVPGFPFRSTRINSKLFCCLPSIRTPRHVRSRGQSALRAESELVDRRLRIQPAGFARGKVQYVRLRAGFDAGPPLCVAPMKTSLFTVGERAQRRSPSLRSR